jgi:hypothetical protein
MREVALSLVGRLAGPEAAQRLADPSGSRNLPFRKETQSHLFLPSPG